MRPAKALQNSSQLDVFISIHMEQAVDTRGCLNQVSIYYAYRIQHMQLNNTNELGASLGSIKRHYFLVGFTLNLTYCVFCSADDMCVYSGNVCTFRPRPLIIG